jgi:hypothetical protein
MTLWLHTTQVIAASAWTTSDCDRSLEPKVSAEQQLMLRQLLPLCAK